MDELRALGVELKEPYDARESSRVLRNACIGREDREKVNNCE